MIIKDKIIIITGGTSGIWKAISLELASKWGKIVSVYGSNTKRAEEFMSEISKITDEYLVLQKDVTNEKELEEIFIETKQNFWSPNILINNAGGICKQDISRKEKLEWWFNLNFFQVVLATDLFEKYKQSDSIGKIINVSSIAGIAPWTFTGWLRYPEYSCAKAALDSYTKQCAKWFGWSILVNGIAPGNTHTPNWEWCDEDFYKLRSEENMIQRFLEPEEIAHSATMLLENDGINGEILVVDWWNILN